MTCRVACLAVLCGNILAASAAEAAQPDGKFDECWRAPFAGHLVEQKTRAAIIALPAGTYGPAEDLDTPNFSWTGPDGGVYRFHFGDFASTVNAVEFDRFALGADTVGVSRWRDFGGVDRVIDQWHAASGSVRDFAVSVPIDPEDCSSIYRAREILRSVKYINDIDRIRIVDTDASPRHEFAVVVNEVGETKRLRKGDRIASQDQLITAIDDRGVTVGWYEYGKGRWAKRRLTVSRDGTK